MDGTTALGHVGVHLERPAALGVTRTSLATFPEEFRAGHGGARGHPRRHRRQPPRALGRRPGRRRPACHRDPVRPRRRRAAPLRAGARQTRRAMPTACAALSYLDLKATPPFNYAHDHFGFRDRLSQPVMRAPARSRRRARARRSSRASSSSATPMRTGRSPTCRSRRSCRATAATWPTADWRSTSARSATILREHGETPEEQELLAAKLMGRWRSGAPLVLAPDAGRPGARRRSAAQQRLQLQGDGPARLCRARSARTSAA